MKFWSIILSSASCLAFCVTLYGCGLALLIALHHLGRLKARPCPGPHVSCTGTCMAVI